MVRLAFALWLGMTVSAATFTLVTVEEEIEIGKQANARVRKSLRELRDREITGYVQTIGRRLMRVVHGPKYPYTFAVADYREVNAFALPGGPVWVHRGVLHAASNESQFAGVLAHEIAHIARRHAAAQLTKAVVAKWGLGLLGAALGNTGGASTAQAAAAMLTNGVFLKFSRDDERDADAVGLRLLMRAGWDGHGMVDVLDLLARESKRNPHAVDVFLSSHPPSHDRAQRLRAELPRARRGQRDSAAFHNVKAQVLKMPPPRAMPRS